MKKSRFSEEQIATTLRQVDAGVPVAEVTRALGVSEPAVSQALAALRQSLGDPSLKVYIEFLQRNFCSTSRGDVLEQHRDLVALFRFNPECGKLQVPLRRH